MEKIYMIFLLIKKKKFNLIIFLFHYQPRTRTSIASEADNQRVFTPTGGSINNAYESDTEHLGGGSSIRSAMRYRNAEENVIYQP